MDIQIGKLNTLQILRIASNGAYIDDGKEGILLPKRYLPQDAKANDEIEVFIYHDNEGRLIATTDKPLAMVDNVAELVVTDLTQHGVFLNNGIMKEVFVHKTNLLAPARIGDKIWVYVYLDRDSRITASEFLDKFIKNEQVQLAEKQAVQLVAYRKTEIGYVMLVDKKYLGLLHFNEVFQPVKIGHVYDGFVKRIIEPTDSNTATKIDLAIGKIGYEKVENETEKIIRYLKENNNYLPFFDKTPADEIVAYFGMSKKTFKMSVGKLYKDRLIIIEDEGIRLLDAE
jgi:uncharacterized protein